MSFRWFQSLLNFERIIIISIHSIVEAERRVRKGDELVVLFVVVFCAVFRINFNWIRVRERRTNRANKELENTYRHISRRGVESSLCSFSLFSFCCAMPWHRNNGVAGAGRKAELNQLSENWNMRGEGERLSSLYSLMTKALLFVRKGLILVMYDPMSFLFLH